MTRAWPASPPGPLKEARYHLRHSSSWVIRLGDGTEESHRRAQDGASMDCGDSPTRCSRGWSRSFELGTKSSATSSTRPGWPFPTTPINGDGGPPRLPHRAPRVPPRRDAVDAAVLPGAGMVMVAAAPTSIIARRGGRRASSIPRSRCSPSPTSGSFARCPSMVAASWSRSHRPTRVALRCARSRPTCAAC